MQQLPSLRPDGMYQIRLIEPSLTTYSMIELTILIVCLPLQILTLFSSTFCTGNYVQKRWNQEWPLWAWGDVLFYGLHFLLALATLGITLLALLTLVLIGFLSFLETIFHVAFFCLQLMIAVDLFLDVGMSWMSVLVSI